jgi:galactose mutarotase-like enzyme
MSEDGKQNHGSEEDWDRRVLQNEHLRIEVLPALGGKLSSITLAGEGGELLQGPLKPYAARTATMPFDQGDGGGWDECLPSIGPCSVTYGDNQTATIEDHGDFWRLAFTVDEATDTTLRMHAEGTSLPLLFERSLRLDGKTLHLDYTLRNRGDAAVPWGWSVHPLFGVYPFDRIHLPPSVKQVTAEASANGRLGAPGSTHSWPITTNVLDGQPLDLSLVESIDTGVGDKLVFPAPPEGWCALERKTLRTRLTLHFDPKDSPVLGMWICYGGWPNDPKAKKGYTVGLEPCNLPVDSLADSLTKGGGSHLAAGEERHWSLRLEIDDAQER